LIAASALTVAVTAPSASADGHAPAYPGSVLHVSVSKPRVAKKVLTITAAGSNAPDKLDVHLSYGLNVIVTDAHTLPGCRTSYNAELTDITDNPAAGRLLTFQSLSEGPSGRFHIGLRWTPGGPGRLQVCAYSMYVSDDAAYASTQVRVVKRAPRRR
jgi:hypothetical protein